LISRFGAKLRRGRRNSERPCPDIRNAITLLGGATPPVCCESRQEERDVSRLDQEVDCLAHQIAAAMSVEPLGDECFDGHTVFVMADSHEAPIMLDDVEDLAQ
jgi:hypothetical protein